METFVPYPELQSPFLASPTPMQQPMQQQALSPQLLADLSNMSLQSPFMQQYPMQQSFPLQQQSFSMQQPFPFQQPFFNPSFNLFPYQFNAPFVPFSPLPLTPAASSPGPTKGHVKLCLICHQPMKKHKCTGVMCEDENICGSSKMHEKRKRSDQAARWLTLKAHNTAPPKRKVPPPPPSPFSLSYLSTDQERAQSRGSHGEAKARRNADCHAC